jgi:hypothetical protein
METWAIHVETRARLPRMDGEAGPWMAMAALVDAVGDDERTLSASVSAAENEGSTVFLTVEGDSLDDAKATAEAVVAGALEKLGYDNRVEAAGAFDEDYNAYRFRRHRFRRALSAVLRRLGRSAGSA